MVEVKITISDVGAMTVQGILQDRILMYGILKQAEKVIDNFYSNQSAEDRNKVTPVKLMPKINKKMAN
jgi:hypothetical protein